MRTWTSLTLFAALAALASCTAKGPATPEPATPTPPPSATPAQQREDLTRTDSQGSVIVEITPIDLAAENELRFLVQMDTHSVDLSMDLSALAELETDLGAHLQAVSWDAPAGGHHVSGTLAFPAQLNGQSILAGARQLVLVLRGIDSTERRFVWELNY
ncbi:MAG: hypothetical protein ACRDG5_11795 [Anaerolineales bacterium]